MDGHSSNEYLSRIRSHVDALKARLDQHPYDRPQKKQDKVRLFFVQRAIQQGEAALRVGDLKTPLFILARVLCEDFLLIFWVSVSPENASEYEQTAIAEWAKLVRVNLTNNRARAVRMGTGKDVTKRALAKLDAFRAERKICSIAFQYKLGKVYDMVYRPGSLYIHGNTFKMEEDREQTVAAALSMINAFLKVILLVADHAAGQVPVSDVLQSLGLHNKGGT